MNQRLFKFLRNNCFTQYKNFCKYRILQSICDEINEHITAICLWKIVYVTFTNLFYK